MYLTHTHTPLLSHTRCEGHIPHRGQPLNSPQTLLLRTTRNQTHQDTEPHLLQPHESGHRDAQSAAAHRNGRPTRRSGLTSVLQGKHRVTGDGKQWEILRESPESDFSKTAPPQTSAEWKAPVLSPQSLSSELRWSLRDDRRRDRRSRLSNWIRIHLFINPVFLKIQVWQKVSFWHSKTFTHSFSKWLINVA